MTTTPRAMVLRSAGTNCEQEMVRAFKQAGAETQLVHLDRVCESPSELDSFDLIGFPGGFSYGDDVASGRLFAARVRSKLYPALKAAAERGVCMIGACNGFQVLVQAGLLPGPSAGEPWPDRPPMATVALSDNSSARFIDRWTRMDVVSSADCVWTRPLSSFSDAAMTLPSAHGEGRLIAEPDVIAGLDAGGQIALRYQDNFNGSADRIAGICDSSGRILGLMPHPERYLDWDRHPDGESVPTDERRGPTPGAAMFRAAVEAVSTQTA